MNLNEELIVCWCAVTVSDFVALCQKMDANLSIHQKLQQGQGLGNGSNSMNSKPNQVIIITV